MDKFFKHKHDDLYNHVLDALRNLGGSASNSEIEEQVIKMMNLSDNQINEIHRGSRTKLNYRLAWTRNYLKNCSLIENSSRGVWSLTESGQKSTTVNKETINKIIYEFDKKQKLAKQKIDNENLFSNNTSPEIEEFGWQDKLIETMKGILPDQFERLCQRLLRELGFVNVEVTGRTNDGGIDGKGIVKIGGVLSYHVVFQAKRFKGSVSSSVIRDFRGAMTGRADKGLVLTTGTFTREAKKEAMRDGTNPIDLIDGSDFAEHLKSLKLGVSIEKVEKVRINKDWFDNI